jgi:hypothetical protein
MTTLMGSSSGTDRVRVGLMLPTLGAKINARRGWGTQILAFRMREEWDDERK